MATRDERLLELAEELATDYKGIWTVIFGAISGSLANLTTSDKTSLVHAINEVKASASGAPPDATTAVKGVVFLASLLEHQAGTNDTKAATVAGVRQEINALKADLLGGATSAYDTLQELYDIAQAGEETSAINALISDVALKANSEDVYTKAQIDEMYGDPDLDLVAAYTAAKA